MKKKIMVSGHRGTRIHAIENTKKAFEYCLKNNIDYIEFDVKKTKDGIPVVFHDARIDRLLNGHGFIESFTLKQLKQFHYEDGQQIMTLEEFFELVDRKSRPMLEIKSRGLGKKIIELAHKYDYKKDELLIQSFTPQDIVECYSYDPQYDYGLCLAYIGKGFPKKLAARLIHKFFLKRYPINWVNIDGPFLYTEFTEQLSQNNISLILGAKTPEKYFDYLDKWNVKIINADDPVQIRELLKVAGKY